MGNSFKKKLLNNRLEKTQELRIPQIYIIMHSQKDYSIQIPVCVHVELVQNKNKLVHTHLSLGQTCMYFPTTLKLNCWNNQ